MRSRHKLPPPPLVLFLGAFAFCSAQAERIISEGDTWRFHNGFTLPAADWYTTNYSDNVSGWFSFPSGFGYGDGDDATVLGDMQNGYEAFFTRKTFVVNNPAAVSYLTLGVDYDDGFVAYINGTEVARSATVTNAVPNENTLAVANHEASRGNGDSNPQEKTFFSVNPGVLVAGTNLIAVSCHNVSLSSSDASLIVEVYTNITLVRGPFVQMPNSNQVTIVWRTDALTDSAVDYGLDLSYASTVSDATLTREHLINIPGLWEGTNYFYRVRSGGVTLWQGDAFHTRRADNQPFRFSIIGDFGQGTPEMTRVAQAVNVVTNADLLLTVGDNIYYDGQPGSFDPWWFSIYAPTMRRAPCMPALGNHDVADGAYSGTAYLNNFYLPMNGPAGQIERNYSFDYGNAHFVTFDSNPTTNASLNAATVTAIKTWLSNDLASTSKPWKFVYFHHPPYTSTAGHDDDEGVKTNYMPIIEAAGVQMVFDGHQHWYERMNAIKGVYHVTSGDSGAGLSTLTSREQYSAVLLTNVYGFTTVDIDGTKLKLTHLGTNGVAVDSFNLDIGHPFKMDGLLDEPAWLRADNGLKLYAAIRGMYLYVATQDAGEGGDNFIYVNNTLSTNRAANWAKAGQVMQWNCFLADENDNAFQGWFGSAEALHAEFPYFQSMTSGINNNGTLGNGVLEGTIDLTNRFGAFPQQLYLAAAAFATTNGGALTAQAPAPVSNNGSVDPNEFLAINTRDIALDLPVANAGTNQTAEAGMTVALDGSASASPSGIPLSFDWTQTSGPAVLLVNSNSAIASFLLASNLNAVLAFRLHVSDTRFSSNATTTVMLTQPVDADGDGLSNQEELTGQDNILTTANPNGQLTDPNNPDSDSDGASDGDEALAGTNPNSALSMFRVTQAVLGNNLGFTIEWSAVAGRKYQVQYRDDLGNAWSSLGGVITAGTAMTNLLDAAAVNVPKRFYRVLLVP